MSQPTHTEFTATEMPEIKRVHAQPLNLEDLSEFELARMTSKTWSMEQD